MQIKVDGTGRITYLSFEAKHFTPLYLHFNLNPKLASEIEYLNANGIPRRLFYLLKLQNAISVEADIEDQLAARDRLIDRLEEALAKSKSSFF